MANSFIELEGIFYYIQQERFLELEEECLEMNRKKGTPLR